MTFIKVFKFVPYDAMIIGGMAGVVYCFGIYTLGTKALTGHEVTYLPKTRKSLKERINSDFEGSSSL